MVAKSFSEVGRCHRLPFLTAFRHCCRLWECRQWTWRFEDDRVSMRSSTESFLLCWHPPSWLLARIKIREVCKKHFILIFNLIFDTPWKDNQLLRRLDMCTFGSTKTYFTQLKRKQLRSGRASCARCPPRRGREQLRTVSPTQMYSKEKKKKCFIITRNKQQKTDWRVRTFVTMLNRSFQCLPD